MRRAYRRPMKVIVVGATGGLGQAVWKAAAAAEHEVSVYVRSPHKLDDSDPNHGTLTIVQGDVMDADAVRDAARGNEALINCTSPAGGNTTLELAKSVVGNGSAAGVRAFYMVGGLGALWAPGTNKTVLLQDWDDDAAMPRYGLRPGMPREQIRMMTKGHLASMAYLAETGLAHTYVCPGLMVDGPESAERVVTLDEIGGTQAGRVTYADIARTIVDDLGRGELLGHRVCVSAG